DEILLIELRQSQKKLSEVVIKYAS
ncbi:MAG: hypothetical protein ACJA1N_001526, partial [Saprospiraceae bacterium]